MEETISRLKFIGHVERGEKIDVKRVIRQPNNFLTRICRMLIYPDSRIQTINFVRDTINNSIAIAENYLIKEDKVRASSVIEDLENAQKGLLNLKSTYLDDTKFCCDVDVILQTLLVKTSELKGT